MTSSGVTIELLVWYTFVKLRLNPGFRIRIQMDSIRSVDQPGIRNPELVFLNLYGAQESMPRHQLRQPM
jgi:hypothetical protein